MSFVPGWQATITLDSENLTATGSVIQLQLSRQSLPKPVFGSKARRTLAGQITGTISAQGHITADAYEALDAAFRKDAAVPITIQMGTATSATDAGSYAGNVVLTQLTAEANADGEWDYSYTAEFDGDATYTAGTTGS